MQETISYCGKDLRGKIFENVKPHVVFRSCNLRGCSFRGSNLVKADFSNSDIRGCDFSNSILKGANFEGVQTGRSTKQTLMVFVFGGFFWAISSSSQWMNFQQLACLRFYKKISQRFSAPPIFLNEKHTFIESPHSIGGPLNKLQDYLESYRQTFQSRRLDMSSMGVSIHILRFLLFGCLIIAFSLLIMVLALVIIASLYYLPTYAQLSITLCSLLFFLGAVNIVKYALNFFGLLTPVFLFLILPVIFLFITFSSVFNDFQVASFVEFVNLTWNVAGIIFSKALKSLVDYDKNYLFGLLLLFLPSLRAGIYLNKFTIDYLQKELHLNSNKRYFFENFSLFFRSIGHGTSFEGSNISNSIFKGARIYDSNFDNANLVHRQDLILG
ncbi:MAG: pentapeptide repeat-containing protein [Cyanobacteria bacterium P01_D01_bin.156]